MAHVRPRAAVLEASLAALPPDLLIIDRHPFGFSGELLPALRRLRAENSASCWVGPGSPAIWPKVATAGAY